jgi:hypothetical protein
MGLGTLGCTKLRSRNETNHLVFFSICMADDQQPQAGLMKIGSRGQRELILFLFRRARGSKEGPPRGLHSFP